MITNTRAMKKEQNDFEEVSCMFIKDMKKMSSDEQLGLFMQRFNLDWDTVETMPAFEEHCKALICRETKK